LGTNLRSNTAADRPLLRLLKRGNVDALMRAIAQQERNPDNAQPYGKPGCLVSTPTSTLPPNTTCQW
jgi:hypothetical protein